MNLTRPFVLLAIAAALVNGCEWMPLDWNRVGFEVYNYTDRSLDIYYVDDGRERKIYPELDPGKNVPIEGLLRSASDCTRGDLIARDAAGVEVARQTEPICDGEEWVIGTPP